MEKLFRIATGTFASAIAFFTPIHGLLICAFVFVGIDFITGIAASYKRSQKNHADWGFESYKAWRTVYKLVFIFGGIVLSWLIDTHVLAFMDMHLANLFTGFVCGVEFWSYLENAAEISEHPVFKWLRKYMKKKIDTAIDADNTIEK